MDFSLSPLKPIRAFGSTGARVWLLHQAHRHTHPNRAPKVRRLGLPVQTIEYYQTTQLVYFRIDIFIRFVVMDFVKKTAVFSEKHRNILFPNLRHMFGCFFVVLIPFFASCVVIPLLVFRLRPFGVQSGNPGTFRWVEAFSARSHLVFVAHLHQDLDTDLDQNTPTLTSKI